MEKERQNNQNKLGRGRKDGYIIVTHYFLKEWVRVLGVGPVVLYQELLTYCHKGKYIAWPTIDSLCKQMGIAKTTLLRYQNTLLRFGLIKNISRGKSTTGHYKNNIYQITPLEKIPDHQDIRYQNDTYNGSKMKLTKVAKRYPNNNNLNNNNITTTKRENAVVDFKKLKEKGEERVQSIREQLTELAFEVKFIEQLIKDFSPAKIEEKLNLLKFRRNIQNPAGWLRVALKNDYQDGQEDILIQDSSIPEGRGSIHRARKETGRINPSPTKNINTPEEASRPSTENKKILSREEALKQIRLARQRLAAITPSYQMEGKWQKKKGEKR